MKYTKTLLSFAGMFLGAVHLLAAPEVRPFRAVVVGVNRYPGTGAKALAGARGDAEAFAQSCRSRGMEGTVGGAEQRGRA